LEKTWKPFCVSIFTYKLLSFPFNNTCYYSSKKSSLAWKHFIKKPNNTAECKYCEKTLKHAGNTTNLMQHLNRKHEVLYKSSDEIRSKKQSTDEAPPAKKRKLRATTTLSRSNSIDAAFTHINDLKSNGIIIIYFFIFFIFYIYFLLFYYL